MTRILQGTAALVTGASSGIGEATASALASEGAAVALVARRRDRLDALAERIRTAGGTAEIFDADVTDRVSAEGAVADAAGALGRLDVVVNNAGVMLLGPALDAPVEEWEHMVQLNLTGLLYVSHAAAPYRCRRTGASTGRRHGQHLLGGRSDRPLRQRRLQRHQVGCERL